MIRLRRLCTVLFYDNSQTQEDWTRGFLDHRTRLKAALPTTGLLKGALAGALADTSTLADQLEALLNTEEIAQRTQQTGHTATDAERTTALTRLRGNEGALRGDYLVADPAKRAELVQLLYPHGMTPYSEAKVDSLSTLLKTYLDLVTANAATLGTDFVARTTTDLTPYAGARNTQVGQQSATGQAQKDLEKLHPQLAEQLNVNYHLLSAFYRGQDTRVLDYFDPRYYDEQAPAHPGQRRERVADNRTRQVLDLSAANAAYVAVALTVTEGERLEFARGAASTDPWPTGALIVEAGKPLRVALASLPGTGPLLLARNPTGRVAHYHVELLKADG